MHDVARCRTTVSQVIISERITGLEGVAFERIRGHAIPEQSITRSITKRFENCQKSAKVALHFCFIFAFDPRRIGNPPGLNALVSDSLIASSISPKGDGIPTRHCGIVGLGGLRQARPLHLRLRKSHAEEVLESHSGSRGASCVEAIAHIDVASVDHVYANRRPCGAVVLGDGEAADIRDFRRLAGDWIKLFHDDNHGSGSVVRKVHLRKSGI